jgi:hypothetical protein
LKLKVKVKKVEETQGIDVSDSSSETTIASSPVHGKIKIKEKKSSVAIIWSPKDEKKIEEIEEVKSSSETPKIASRDAFSPRDVKRTPFVPRYTPAQGAIRTPFVSKDDTRTSPQKKDETKTPFVFTPRTTESRSPEKKVFGVNKQKGGTGKTPFSFGERHGGKKTLKVRGYAEDD